MQTRQIALVAVFVSLIVILQIEATRFPQDVKTEMMRQAGPTDPDRAEYVMGMWPAAYRKRAVKNFLRFGRAMNNY
ncbi:hypothetical protein L596_021009 [Steinernema carpocapsae]|uniref:Uncharacterized protein n=1 Tax=Steinernema carpocapsae TaxID=34508 RepID=A0A4U5MV88_STECR|nr:hypothetical protein L596_021009 [Steinernema carpocapsae]